MKFPLAVGLSVLFLAGVVCAASSPPTPTSPGSPTPPGPIISTATPTLSWSGIPTPPRYGLYISIAPYGKNNLVYSNDTLTGTSLTIPLGYLVSGGQYRWDMASFDSSGQNRRFSSNLYFQVAAPGPGVTIPERGNKRYKKPLDVDSKNKSELSEADIVAASVQPEGPRTHPPTPNIIQRYSDTPPLPPQVFVPEKPSRTVQFSGQNQIVISVMVGATTEIIFPSRITKIVPGCGEDEVSIEVSEGRMWVKPFSPWEGVIFVLVGDLSYPVRITPASSPDVQVFVSGPGPIAATSSGGLSTPSRITEYLKLLFLEDAPEKIDVNKEVYKEKNFVIRFQKQLNWDFFTGYIGEIENTSSSLIVVPVEEISVPNLVAISVDKETLPPSQKSTCYFLFKRVE